jgi:hypothetical protein
MANLACHLRKSRKALADDHELFEKRVVSGSTMERLL